jgi:hypothetical protein
VGNVRRASVGNGLRAIERGDRLGGHGDRGLCETRARGGACLVIARCPR